MTSPDRVFRLGLATLFLLAQVLWTPALRVMSCTGGDPAACCCVAPADPVREAKGCCAGGDEAPRPVTPDPCGCQHRPAPAPVPVPDPMPRAAEVVAIAPAPMSAPAAPILEASAFRPAPEPRSRTGPPLHLRFCVFLD